MIFRTLLTLGAITALATCVIAMADRDVLYEKDSAFNTIVVTEDEQGLRTLRFEKQGARQSVVKVGDPDHLELPYARAMLLGVAFCQEPKRSLVVGLGGGTIPSFLHKHYPRTTIDVVDIDPDVVDVAKRFFGFRENDLVHAYVQDGRQFIERHRGRYDIVFLDAFSSDAIPYHLATREFLQAVRGSLTRDGIAVANVWSSTSNPLYDSMVRTYQDVFDELYIFEVQGAGNRIVIASQRKIRISRDDLARRSRAISQAKGFRFDLGDLVTFGYQEAREANVRGQVLRDNGQAKKAG